MVRRSHESACIIRAGIGVSFGARRPHRWVFPVSSDVEAEICLRGGEVTAEHIRTLRSHLAILERTLGMPTAPAEQDLRVVDPVTPGDLAQLAPSSDPVFGGLVMRVCQCASTLVRGYFLVPHRGGAREAWQKFKQSELERVGRIRWPEGEWGFRTPGTGKRAGLWSE